MGRVAAPWGVRGWIKVQPFTEAAAALLDYPAWWIVGDDGEARPRRVIEGRQHADTLVARLEGIDTREDAARYRGREVAVPRESLPGVEDDEVYLADLVGLEVVNRGGDALGRVADVSQNAAQPILRVVARDGTERLIPCVPAIVDEVDLESARITVDWQADY
jgi:16S rRNA processing protein RimM